MDDQTCQSAGDGFAFRLLGRIIMAGRAAPACVHELAGYAGAANADFAESCDTRTRAISHYQSYEWDSCLGAPSQCRALRPEDRFVALYARSVENLRIGERPSACGGAIRIGAEETAQD